MSCLFLSSIYQFIFYLSVYLQLSLSSPCVEYQNLIDLIPSAFSISSTLLVSVRQSVSQSVCQSVHVSVIMCVCMSIYVYVCLYVRTSVCLSRFKSFLYPLTKYYMDIATSRLISQFIHGVNI